MKFNTIEDAEKFVNRLDNFLNRELSEFEKSSIIGFHRMGVKNKLIAAILDTTEQKVLVIIKGYFLK